MGHTQDVRHLLRVFPNVCPSPISDFQKPSNCVACRPFASFCIGKPAPAAQPQLQARHSAGFFQPNRRRTSRHCLHNNTTRYSPGA